MKILAVDTATQSCSIAIVDADALLAELTLVKAETHSRHLLEMIHAVIAMAGLSVSDVDGFAVTIGPGSFTGLRIGISSVKALAYASDKPVVGVSSLDALAMQCAYSAHLICPLIDARKGEVYVARYRLAAGLLHKEMSEQVSRPAEAVRDIREPCLFVGSGARLYHEIIAAELKQLAHFATPELHTIRAMTVAMLSRNKFETQNTDDVSRLVPHYIRKSDAEMNITRVAR